MGCGVRLRSTETQPSSWEQVNFLCSCVDEEMCVIEECR